MTMPESHRIRGSRKWVVHILDNCQCVYCGDTPQTPHVDHLQSRANGGAVKSMSNLVTACPQCNAKKGKRPVTAVFGQDVAMRVRQHVSTRRNPTPADWDCARIIPKLDNECRIESALDWAELGLGPMVL